MPPSLISHSSSFTTRRISSRTFVIREADAYAEHPLIYVKIHPKAPVIVLSDTGCDEPDEAHNHDKYIHLRDYIENCPLAVNGDQPLNPGGTRQYFVIFTHCHYDHTGGIAQFLEGGRTEIIASAAGCDFIESDFEGHGLYRDVGKVAPYFRVTYWAQAFERLQWPLRHHAADRPRPYQTDLGISIIHTPGHTPDELAWYDEAEMRLGVGDSFYEEGDDGMPIIFPEEGSLVEWVFSMQKLLVFVRSENARAAAEAERNGDGDDWVTVARRVRVSCAHQTASIDGEEILERLERFAARVYQGEVPIVKKELWRGGAYYTWRDTEGGETKMSLKAPARLMDEARRFFNLSVK